MNLNFHKNDPIIALATASGMGAIALIRVSGKNCLSLLPSFFNAAKKDFTIDNALSHHQYFGEVVDKDIILDEVLISIYRNPKSFTGEDSFEISCHGSVYIQQKIIELLVQKGIRLAEPGEFTMRAFANGKFDLAQAEAVADLIASTSYDAHRIALRQMKGTYSNRIQELRQQLVNFASLIELELDFAEEEVEFADRTHFLELLNRMQQEFEALIKSFELGKAINSGIPVTIAGKPNVGKSTLLNVLLEEERAIVSDIPGTTRDVIEDTINLNGTLFRFIDTAGIRPSNDHIEQIGVGLSKKKIKEASIILYLIDINDNLPKETIKAELEAAGIDTEHPQAKLIVLLNKIDNKEKGIPTELENCEASLIPISAKKLYNIDLLKDELMDYVGTFNIANEAIVTNARHIEAFRKSLDGVLQIKNAFDMEIPTDLIATDVRQVLYHLGSITGDITTDELLGNIFSKFCIGK